MLELSCENATVGTNGLIYDELRAIRIYYYVYNIIIYTNILLRIYVLATYILLRIYVIATYILYTYGQYVYIIIHIMRIYNSYGRQNGEGGNAHTCALKGKGEGEVMEMTEHYIMQ